MTFFLARRGRVLLFALVALGSIATASTTQDLGVIERVVDGDTVIVTGLGSVRLIGVDTPETVHPTKAVEAFGHQSSAFLRRLVLNQNVRLEYDGERKDRYGRTLAYVYLTDGTFVNAEIVRQGYGHAYTQFPFKYLEEFRQFEREAREEKRGLWRDPLENRKKALCALTSTRKLS